MAAKIKLSRIGKKGKPAYRIVVADESTKRQGHVVAALGFYNPSETPVRLEYDKEAFQSWLAKGAQPTEGIRKLLHL